MSSLNCFVIMPFSDTVFIRNNEKIIVSSDEWDFIFSEWIKKAVESFGNKISCKRSPLAPGNFIKGIVKNISLADITIADLTGGKPNVYYELGIRHSLRNGTIIITQNFSDLPSDLKSYYCFEYEYSSAAHKYQSSYTKFEGNIHKYINHILVNNYPADNPISDYLELDNKKSTKGNILDNAKIKFDDSMLLSTIGGIEVIKIKEITYLEAKGGYTKINFEKKPAILSSFTLRLIIEKINSDKIVRIHNSYAVNKGRIKKIFLNEVELDNGITLPLSRARRDALVTNK